MVHVVFLHAMHHRLHSAGQLHPDYSGDSAMHHDFTVLTNNDQLILWTVHGIILQLCTTNFTGHASNDKLVSWVVQGIVLQLYTTNLNSQNMPTTTCYLVDSAGNHFSTMHHKLHRTFRQRPAYFVGSAECNSSAVHPHLKFTVHANKDLLLL